MYEITSAKWHVEQEMKPRRDPKPLPMTPLAVSELLNEKFKKSGVKIAAGALGSTKANDLITEGRLDLVEKQIKDLKQILKVVEKNKHALTGSEYEQTNKRLKQALTQYEDARKTIQNKEQAFKDYQNDPGKTSEFHPAVSKDPWGQITNATNLINSITARLDEKNVSHNIFDGDDKQATNQEINKNIRKVDETF